MHVSLINITAFGLTLFLSVFAFNVSRVTHDRIDLQYGVDAAVVSAATAKARGMNAVTAMNHVIGELHSLTLLHDALGGKRADNPSAYQPIRGEWVQWVNGWLVNSRYAARGMGARTFAYRDVRKNINANMALFRAKMTLKERLTQVYYAKAAVLLLVKEALRAVAIEFGNTELGSELTLISYQLNHNCTLSEALRAMQARWHYDEQLERFKELLVAKEDGNTSTESLQNLAAEISHARRQTLVSKSEMAQRKLSFSNILFTYSCILLLVAPFLMKIPEMLSSF